MAPERLNRVAILGPGRVGMVLARAIRETGRAVKISGPDDPAEIAMIVDIVAPGATALWAEDAVAESDAVILAVPLHKVHELDAASLRGKIVVDVMNYWQPVDGTLDMFEGERGTSEVVHDLIGPVRLVKTFNHLSYRDLEEDPRPVGHAERRAVAVAGDDEDARRSVMRLVHDVGFDAVDAGSLERGRALEAGGEIFGARMTADEMKASIIRTCGEDGVGQA